MVTHMIIQVIMLINLNAKKTERLEIVGWDGGERNLEHWAIARRNENIKRYYE